jgi:hypothetical protein
MSKFGELINQAIRDVREGRGIARISVPVVSAKQSPLNPTRWCCTLQCGHDMWVTSKRKPKAKLLDCQRCREVLNE